jgi:heme exporter protein A
MLEAHDLSCIRDAHALFVHLSLTLSAGELLQVEGANGAGKTSLLRILAGLSQPERGQVCWQGQPIGRCRDHYQSDLLYIGHKPGIKAGLTALENLAFYHQVPEAGLWQALACVGLAGYEDLPAGQLSAGQQRRVALARLWLSRAALWILDEPFTALDKAGSAALLARLRGHAEAGGLVLLTSHQPLDLPAERLRRLSLHHGKAA